MIGLVIVTHGRLAIEFRAALEDIVGSQTQLETISIGSEDDTNARRADILDAIRRADSGQGVIVLTDMFGGTPSNLAISVMEEAKVEVLAGINLPILVKLAGLRSEVELARDAGRKFNANGIDNEWSVEPPSVCPVIGAFMRRWDDGLRSDEERTALLGPLIPTLIGTRGSKVLEHRRAMMAVDWLIRVHRPAWLRLARLDKQADALASSAEITDLAQCPLFEAARTDAGGARAAAWAAIWEVAHAGSLAQGWDETWDAARAAVWAGTSAGARDVARAATWWAGAYAGGDAILDATGEALSKTRTELRVSARALVERMITATD